jgi:hypothetical protein
MMRRAFPLAAWHPVRVPASSAHVRVCISSCRLCCYISGSAPRPRWFAVKCVEHILLLFGVVAFRLLHESVVVCVPIGQ